MEQRISGGLMRWEIIAKVIAQVAITAAICALIAQFPVLMVPVILGLAFLC